MAVKYACPGCGSESINVDLKELSKGVYKYNANSMDGCYELRDYTIYKIKLECLRCGKNHSGEYRDTNHRNDDYIKNWSYVYRNKEEKLRSIGCFVFAVVSIITLLLMFFQCRADYGL